MCNINLIKRKDGKLLDTTNRFMELVSWNSWLTNHDGEGFIAFKNDKDIEVKRSLKKIDYISQKTYSTIISHQRYTTSGGGLNNTHPHSTKNFVLQHNGVFIGYGDKSKSDTRYYCEKLEENYQETKDIIKAILETNKLFSGSMSIILLDKNTGKVYYYKNSSTTMYFLDSKKYFFMSTVHNNLMIAKRFFNLSNDIKSVDEDIIYLVTSKGLKVVHDYRKIELDHESKLMEWFKSHKKPTLDDDLGLSNDDSFSSGDYVYLDDEGNPRHYTGLY